MSGQPPSSPTPRAAATVILARDGPRGLETFMVRRGERARQAANAYVFPGGQVEPQDTAGGQTDAYRRAAGAVAPRYEGDLDVAMLAAAYACAPRELFEEAGVLLARGARGEAIPFGADPELAAWLDERRSALLTDRLSLSDLLAEHGWTLDLDSLTPFSHWVTPEGAPARFDTWFFVAVLPSGQQARHCGVETFAGDWLAPRDVLDAHQAGRLSVIYPTYKHLARIATCASAADLLAFARAKRIRRVQPVLVRDAPVLTGAIPAWLENAW